MARPQKKGLDYFPLDTTMDQTNDDIVMLEAKYPKKGFKTIIKLYMKIYSDEGYFINWNEKSSLLLTKRVNTDINLINSIINDLVSWEVFDKKLYKKYKVLTSQRIQKTYFEAVKKRKEVVVFKNYLLVDSINDNINLINAGINPQSKEDYIKENYIKELSSVEKKELIPYDKILYYLNLKTGKLNKSVFQQYGRGKKTDGYIKGRWEDNIKKKLNYEQSLDAFNKCIDNTYLFRMKQGGDLTHMKPSTIFNGKFWERVTGERWGFKEEIKKEDNLTYRDV